LQYTFAVENVTGAQGSLITDDQGAIKTYPLDFTPPV
jgi:hypothetical protein